MMRPRLSRLGTALLCCGAALALCPAAVAQADAVRPAASRSSTSRSSASRSTGQRPGRGELSTPVRSDGLIRLRWTPIGHASSYEVVLVGGAGRPVPQRPVRSYRIRPAGSAAGGTVHAYETSGFQPLGYAATSGRPVSSTGAALLSPAGTLPLSGPATVIATLAARPKLSGSPARARTGVEVMDKASTAVRYAIAATVRGRVRYATHVVATRIPLPSSSASNAAASGTAGAASEIVVDSGTTYQRMAGFGATLNDSSAYELTRGVGGLGTRAGLKTLESEPGLQDLFSSANGIALSYVRVSIGGNDFAQADYGKPLSLANEYTENDPAPGSTATTFSAAQLQSFIAHDLEYQVPVLQAARALNPSLKIMAAPWTAPIWMKCENVDAEAGTACQAFDPTGTQAELSGDPGYAGGTLNPADVPQYADYLLEFLLAYRAEGLPISAISLGNEPGNNTWSYPSMEISPAVEAKVAADLSADMRAAGVTATILALDHNWNTAWPQTLDPISCGSSCYLSQLLGVATKGTFGAVSFHCYGGAPSAQSSVSLPIDETECAPLGYYTEALDPADGDDYSTAPANFAGDLSWDTENLAIAALRDGDSDGVVGAGSQTVMLWDMAGDQDYGPTINTGCTTTGAEGACLPLEELTNGSDPTREVGYYILGQLSRFVQPGAVRIASTESGDLDTVAFQDPDGRIVLVVLNTQNVVCAGDECLAPSGADAFSVDWQGHRFVSSLPAGAVKTYVWNG